MNTHTKIFISMAAAVALFAGFNHTNAQEGLLFGQHHAYSVIFRGNGEAIVYARLAIPNPGDTALSEVMIDVPGVEPTEIVMYQQKRGDMCVRYDYSMPEYQISPPCLEYQDPDYTTANSYWYYNPSQGNEYQKIQYKKEGTVYRLTLPTPIKPYKTGGVIISYATKGYVDVNGGLFTFAFETLKVPTRIQEIKVSVDVDSDLFMKGKRAEVNYGISSERMAAPSTAPTFKNAEMDRIVGNIGGYAPLMKDAKNLAPNESFIVNGEYATSWWRLYLQQILLVIVVILAIFVGVYFLSRFLRRKLPPSSAQNTETPTPPTTGHTSNMTALINLTSVGAGFLSAVGTIGLTYLLRFISESQLLRGIYDEMFIVVAMFAIGLLYLFIVLGPAVLLAIRHGWKALIVVLVAEFLWFLLFLIVYLVFFQTGLLSPPGTVYPTVMEGGSMTK